MSNRRIPTHKGEKEVQSLLDSYQSCELDYWFSLDYLPSVPDLDLLLLDKKSGVFAIEIKAIPLSEIIEISLTTLEIRGRGRKKSSNEQAYDALLGIMNYAKRNSSTLPFMVATTMWPKITRADWKLAFSESTEIRDLADNMIFQDDLICCSVLSSRLSYIYRNPAIRKGSDKYYQFYDLHLANLEQLLDTNEVAPARPSCSKFQMIASTQRSTTLKKYPIGSPLKLVLEGIPGSGKTYSLLTLAQLHGSEGRSVLLLCFNKALAAQLRVNVKTIAEDMGDPELKEFINVLDVFQHASSSAGSFGITGISRSNYQDWLELILDELKSQDISSTRFPDVLLVDEVQDFSPIEQEWIKFWASNSNWVAFAKGIGQEIYTAHQANDFSWLEPYKRESLTMNYRNPGKLFLLSSLLGETKLNCENLYGIASSTAKKIRNRELSINRIEEVGFKLQVVDDSNESSLIEGYITAIRDGIRTLDSNGKEHFQLLVLTRGLNDRKRCQRAMSSLKESDGIEYLDLTIEENRRLEPTANQVRLCTYESARGLEAEVVVVVGFELLVSDDITDANLALVALSRAINTCTITVKRERAVNLPVTLDKFINSVGRVLNDI
ncbi:AAA family ATPase [Vibrio harveyi]